MISIASIVFDRRNLSKYTISRHMMEKKVVIEIISTQDNLHVER